MWYLTNSIAPIKIKDTGASAGPTLERAQATPLGTDTLRLLNARPLDIPAGSRVETKGRYVVMEGEERISVLSLQMLSPTC